MAPHLAFGPFLGSPLRPSRFALDTLRVAESHTSACRSGDQFIDTPYGNPRFPKAGRRMRGSPDPAPYVPMFGAGPPPGAIKCHEAQAPAASVRHTIRRRSSSPVLRPATI